MSKITIVITYYDRQIQLNNTLNSLIQYDPKDFNVIIVDDCSPEDIILPDLPFEVIIIKTQNKTWTCSAPVFNIGFNYALKDKPDIVIIQNAECYHGGDILSYARKITNKTYISFGCYSQGKGESVGTIINNRMASVNGDSAWYNHPVYRPVGYHFCTAITSKNLIKLNGFDERFSYGCGYEDDYFMHQIRNLGLKIEITDDPIVFHQYHYDIKSNFTWELYNNNQKLLQELIKTNDYRAKHILTPDLK